MVDASGLPGICRSNTGVADTEDPCTNSIVPLCLSDAAAAPFLSCLRHMSSLTLSAPARLTVQCAVPMTSASGSASAAASPDGRAMPAHAAAAALKNLRRDGVTGGVDVNSGSPEDRIA